MRKPILWAILMLACTCGTAQAAVRMKTRITDVTLYIDQVQIHRRGKAMVPPGMTELLIDTRAFRIDADSVTARVLGDGQIISVQYKEIPVSAAPQPEIAALEKQLDGLTLKKREQVDRRQTLSDQKTFLDALLDFSKTRIRGEARTGIPDPQELTGTLTFLRENYQRIRRELRDVDQQINRIEKDIDTVRRKLALLQSPSENRDKVISVVFNSETGQEITVEASYTSPDAAWSPVYKAAVAPELSGIDLTMFAHVVQTTGEPWSRVRLTVSNVIPLKGVQLPDLHSWWIDMPEYLTEFRNARSSRAMAESKESLEMPLFTKSPAPKPAGPARASKSRTALSFEYTLPQPVDIPSRNRETLLPLFSKHLTGEFYHFTVPEKTPLTFLVAEATADSELLAGPLNLYFGGRYVGKTAMPEKKAGAAFLLNLGADRQVIARREKIIDKKDETFFGKIERDTVVRKIRYRLSVENIKDSPVRMKILDHLPVSRTDKIVVKNVVLKPEPAQKDYEGREGVLMWDLSLSPGEKKTIEMGFEISHPKDAPPEGL